MTTRLLSLAFVLLPLGMVAQVSTAHHLAEPAPLAQEAFNALTMAVLRANCPAHIEEAQWLKMMQEPVNRSLYPLRVTQAMLESLDATQLDKRFQYVMERQ